jgi:glycosyltransferase involved in cell wall biosynthesis
MMPTLTVLMTVYNAGDYLAECVESILNQTYRDFTLLIIDDGSTDGSGEIAASFRDPRIRLLRLSKNIGQIAAMNKGLEMIETPLIARMDADDISMPQRFAHQVAYMENHPDTGICGTYAIAFEGIKRFYYSYPCRSHDIKVKLLFENCLVHSSVMMRRELLDRHNLRYNDQLKHSYDWELWQRAANHFDLANIPEYQVRYRIHEESVTFRTSRYQIEAAEQLDSVSLALLGLDDHPLRKIHRDVSLDTYKAENRDMEFLSQVGEWFDALREANRIHRVFDGEALNRFLKKRLFVVCTMNTRHWRQALTCFMKEGLIVRVNWLWSLKFFVKIFLSALRLSKV